MKICTRCNKPGIFHRDAQRKDGLHPQCVTCCSEQRKDWRRRNPQKAKEQSKTNRENQKKKPDFKERQGIAFRKYRLKKKYGLTPETWEIKFNDQGRCCAICQTIEPGLKGWSTDHDHETSQTRSILCGLCNAGIGCLKDSPDILRKAADYIEFWKNQNG